MIDLILLAGLSYALYRMAVEYNITPWKWIVRYVLVFFASILVLSFVLIAVYGPDMVKDVPAMEKIMFGIEPFVLLYQVILFFFLRTRIVRYVHDLDQIDRNNNNNIPDSTGKDQKDFSYFR